MPVCPNRKFFMSSFHKIPLKLQHSSHGIIPHLKHLLLQDPRTSNSSIPRGSSIPFCRNYYILVLKVSLFHHFLFYTSYKFVKFSLFTNSFFVVDLCPVNVHESMAISCKMTILTWIDYYIEFREFFWGRGEHHFFRLSLIKVAIPKIIMPNAIIINHPGSIQL